jgi:hypothetical protein
MRAWRIQKLAGDVVWDLRNRGLLPLMAVLGVALVVVPVVISRQAHKATPSKSAVSAATVSAPEARSAVVAYDPGLRDYRKRLDALKAKDPFVQHFSSTATDKLSSTASATTSSVSTSTGTSVGATVNTGGSGRGSSKVVTRTETRYVSYQLTVMVGEVGSLKRHTDVPTLSFLPGEKTPVLVYLGVGGNGSKALFLVSSDVTGVSGDGVCGLGPGLCDLLVLRTGQYEDLDYAPDGKTYRVKVTKLKRVVSSTPPG